MKGDMMKAIETVYQGVRYRSRLEARWAVAFQEMGLDASYEPEGFEYDGDRYLPDFQLVDSGIFVSIKPMSAMIDKSEPVVVGYWMRELLWQNVFSLAGKRLWIIAGDPQPDRYVINLDVVDNYSKAEFYDCPKCDGICYVLMDGGWGKIAPHTCGDHDRQPCCQDRVKAAMFRAMAERFGERQAKPCDELIAEISAAWQPEYMKRESGKEER